MDWSFQLDGVMHDISQEDVHTKVAADIAHSALNGYNGRSLCTILITLKWLLTSHTVFSMATMVGPCAPFLSH